MPATRLLAPVLLVTVAACSGGGPSFSQPKPAAFSPGSCRELASPVLQLGKELHSLGGSNPTAAQRTALKTAQSAVRRQQPTLPTSLAPPVQDMVTAVGVLRLRADTNSYDPALAGSALTAYQALVTVCTRAVPPNG